MQRINNTGKKNIIKKEAQNIMFLFNINLSSIAEKEVQKDTHQKVNSSYLSEIKGGFAFFFVLFCIV